jgi:hypothetical protein
LAFSDCNYDGSNREAVAHQPSPQQAISLIQVYTENTIIFDKSFRLDADTHRLGQAHIRNRLQSPSSPYL